MAQYSFSISNYHSISKADIRLNGITVIAGCNGSGKSTIARWIYSFVNYTNNFHNLIDRQLVRKLESKLYSMYRILRNSDSLTYSKLRQFKSLSENDLIDDYSEISAQFEIRVRVFCEIVEKMLSENDTKSFKRWLSQALGYEGEVSVDSMIDFYNRAMDELSEEVYIANERKHSCRIQDLFQFIQKDLDLITDLPHNIEFKENGHNLIFDNRFLIPLNLGNAIYIDTPMALSTKFNADNRIWNDMMNALTESYREMPSTARKIRNRLCRIIGGRIEVYKEEIGDSYDIRYIRSSDNLDISINEAATGLKTFTYILRLLENGYLNENSILLIDEPEAHLHPQWIVEFARILVLLHKEVGTTILLASHNPDMVAALKSISEAEEIDHKVSFYQAILNENTQKYTYQYLGNSIEEIFESFNIALNRIKDYGC